MSIFAGPKLRYLWGKHNEITFKNFDQKGIHERLYPFNVSAVIGVGVNISRIFFDDVENDVVSFHSFISKIKFLIRDTYFKRTKLMKINKE